MALENIKFANTMLYESRETVIKLFNDYFSILFEAKYKRIHGKWIPSMLARVACVAKFSDDSNFKIPSPKQMLQRLAIVLTKSNQTNYIFLVSGKRNY